MSAVVRSRECRGQSLVKEVIEGDRPVDLRLIENSAATRNEILQDARITTRPSLGDLDSSLRYSLHARAEVGASLLTAKGAKLKLPIWWMDRGSAFRPTGHDESHSGNGTPTETLQKKERKGIFTALARDQRGIVDRIQKEHHLAAWWSLLEVGDTLFEPPPEG